MLGVKMLAPPHEDFATSTPNPAGATFPVLMRRSRSSALPGMWVYFFGGLGLRRCFTVKVRLPIVITSPGFTFFFGLPL